MRLSRLLLWDGPCVRICCLRSPGLPKMDAGFTLLFMLFATATTLRLAQRPLPPVPVITVNLPGINAVVYFV